MPKSVPELPKREVTPGMLVAQLHYQNIGLLGGNVAHRVAPLWNSSRVNRLCAMANCSPWDLASVFLLDPIAFQRWWITDRWPSSTALHFQRHEVELIQQRTGAVQAVIPPECVPDHPQSDCPTCGGPLFVTQSK